MHPTVVLFATAAAVLLTTPHSFAQDDTPTTTTTDLPTSSTPANLLSDTEIVDTNRLIKEFESTLPSDPDDTTILSTTTTTSTTSTTTTTPEPPPHNNASDAAANVTEPMTPEEIQRLLLPPAKVEASIAHLEDATDDGANGNATAVPSEKSNK